MKKKMSLVLAMLLLIMVPIQAMAVSDGFSDMPNDWSTKAFNEAIDNGLIKGYEGQVFPKKNLTRAEMAAIMNRALRSEAEASLSGYVDVAPGSWQHDEMSKAVGSKIFQGSGNRLHPNDMITREEAFVVLSRVMNIRSSAQNKMAFYDLGSISSWAREEMNGMLNAGYVKGSNGFINPKAPITRAEFVQLMSNVVQTYIDSPDTHKSVKPGNVVVNVPGATLKDVTITGDLIIGDGVGEGEVTLDGVAVTGRLLVRAGGENSIILKGDSTVGSVSVVKNGKAVRILNETKKDLPEIFIEGESDVILAGMFKNVHVKSEKVVIHIKDGEIKNINMNGADSELKVDKGSTVKDVKIDAPKIVISGLGKVEDVSVEPTGSGSKITTPNTIIFVERGAKDVTGTGNEELATNKEYENGTSDRIDAKPVDGTSDRDSGGSGGGGGSTRPPVVKYSVDYRVVGVGGALTTSVATNSAITSGTDLVFEATAEEGYEIKEWKVNNTIVVVEGNKLTLDIDKNTVVTVEFAPVTEEPVEEPVTETFDVTFTVLPEGVDVVLMDSDDVAIEPVEGVYTVEAGEYSYTASKEGYVTIEDVVTVSEDMVISVVLELIEETPGPTFDIVFNITPVDAVVVFTDSLGNPIDAVGGVYTVEAGEYSYEVSKEGYYTADDTFAVSMDRDITITLHEVESVTPIIVGFTSPTTIELIEGDTLPTLPSTVMVILDTEAEVELAVVWDTSSFVGEVGSYELTGELVLVDGITNPDMLEAVQAVVVSAPAVDPTPDSYIDGVGTLDDIGGVLSTSFTWGSVNGIGSLDETISGSYGYYTDGAYLSFQVKDSTGTVVSFADVLETIDDGNNDIGGMTLQTNGGNVNDMDGSNREKADWGIAGFEGFETNLPGISSLYYGVIQNATVGTKTVGFGPAEARTIDMTLMPRADLLPGVYTVVISVMQQNGEMLDTAAYTFEIETPAPTPVEVSFNVTPADADVILKDVEGVVVEPVGGVYMVVPGEYTYVVTKEGYVEIEQPALIMNDYTFEITLEEVPAPAPDSYIAGSGTLTDEGTFLSASFTWGSVNGVGSLEETISGSYGYYTDGAYLRFQVENTTGTAVSFAEVFETLDDGNNSTGGMTLQTNGGNVNDMDGSNREKADWGVAGFEGFETNLPGVNSLYYGVIQNATVGTKTVGFGPAEARTIDMTLIPRADLLPGTYTVIVDVIQQNGSALGDSMIYTFTK